jgi:hypothetical protein
MEILVSKIPVVDSLDADAAPAIEDVHLPDPDAADVVCAFNSSI